MRFGKKLALQVMEDNSGAPYLSHKPMKEAINRTVRELRLYQARVQSTQYGGGPDALAAGGGNFSGGDAANNAASPSELVERIRELDRQLFVVVDDDLARILAYVRQGELRLSAHLAQLQDSAMEAGILVQEVQLERLEKVLPNTAQDRAALALHLLNLRMRSDPGKMTTDIDRLAVQCNVLIDVANHHAQYLEINVAGFRKLLKRHEKQIPLEFRSRTIPSLGFHRLVTHTSRQLLDLVKQISAVIVDAGQRLEEVASPDVILRALQGNQWTQLVEQRGLGPECEMVLNIQKQLKHPVKSQLLTRDQNGPNGGSTMHLYPKPFSASGFPASKGAAQGQNQQQQQAALGKGNEDLPHSQLGHLQALGAYAPAAQYQMGGGGGWGGWGGQHGEVPYQQNW
mmetsp:Transcript_23383/g.59745  ORF Transcript_23383/g.59745 Transcript_23383/m.59745 type:complete len:399 (-) Transcript_23383:7-1203(-)